MISCCLLLCRTLAFSANAAAQIILIDMIIVDATPRHSARSGFSLRFPEIHVESTKNLSIDTCISNQHSTAERVFDAWWPGTIAAKPIIDDDCRHLKWRYQYGEGLHLQGKNLTWIRAATSSSHTSPSLPAIFHAFWWIKPVYTYIKWCDVYERPEIMTVDDEKQWYAVGHDF